MRVLLLTAAVGLLVAAPVSAGVRTNAGNALAIERTDPMVWPAAYQRLLTALRAKQGQAGASAEERREVDEIALRYLDRALLAGSVDQGQLAAVVEEVGTPELKAAGYLRLARWAGTARWLRPALDVLQAAPVPQPYATNLAAAIADTAVEFGSVQLASEAVAEAEPGPVRASVASRIARLKGADPDASDDWAEDVERLVEAGDLQGAIELAVAADAWKERGRRDEVLRALALQALDEMGPAAALHTANAIYSVRERGLLIKDIAASLTKQGRLEEAAHVAAQVRDPKAASAVWLQLADEAKDDLQRAERLEQAYEFARHVEDEDGRSDATADALKRIAERDWYRLAYERSACIGSAEQRARVVSAAAKRAAEFGDVAASEEMLASLGHAEAESVRRARSVLDKARRKSGEASAIPADQPPRAGSRPLQLAGCSGERGPVEAQATLPRLARHVGLIAARDRRAELARMSGSVRESMCALSGTELDDVEPLSALRSTDEYGTDQRAEDFSWRVMVLAGRHLAGDAGATESLAELLEGWAEAAAFEKTETAHDAYYALKRSLLPTVVAFTLVEGEMRPDEAARVEAWLDKLVRRIDRRFDGDVDRNNHRYLADSVQMAWGSWIGDAALFQRGLASLEMARQDIAPDGTLPLEVRRGARALWYMRQAASSFTVMIRLLERQGLAALAEQYRTSVLLPVVDSLVDGVLYPTKLLLHSPENYIPGEQANYFDQDLGFLDRRGHGRHYMAWVELLLAGQERAAPLQRLQLLATREVFEQRPLVDEFAGGNATCFWATQPMLRGQG